MFGEIVVVMIIVMVVRVLRGDSLARPMLWVSSFAWSFLGVLIIVEVLAKALFPQVG